MTSPLPVLINRGGGAAAATTRLSEQITGAFAACGMTVTPELLDSAGLADAIERVPESAGTIVIGGGDGTLGSVAGQLARRGATLGILPLGTRNHLARQLGIPADLGAAAALIAEGRATRIDFGEVNGLSFVNNASIGAYPLLVRWRDAERHRRGLPKWLATLPAAVAALRRLPHHRLQLEFGGRREVIRTPLLFIGNNRYSLARGSIGERASIEDGLLSIVAAADRGRLGLIGLAWRTLLGLGDAARDFAVAGDCERLIVHAHAKLIDIALDGETHRLCSPLEFTICKRGLNVIVSAPQRPA